MTMIVQRPWRSFDAGSAENSFVLRHMESELCWCDPIIRTDEDGEALVIHREVTWN
jgi:hypothetical protein